MNSISEIQCKPLESFKSMGKPCSYLWERCLAFPRWALRFVPLVLYKRISRSCQKGQNMNLKSTQNSSAEPNSKRSLGLSEISSSNPEQRLSEWFLRFSDQATASPMYHDLSKQIAGDAELLRLANFADPLQPAPNLFLAAVHFLLMRYPTEFLSIYYPSLGGHFHPSLEMFQAFQKFCQKFEAEIQELLQTKLVQTNEVQRCALLLPALNLISQKLNHPKIALIDVGSSGGLNLLMDQAHIRYSDGTATGSDTSPLQLQCESRGEKVPSFSLVKLATRIGVDLNPVNLLDPSERQWNLALIWPDQIERFERVKSALQLLEKTEITFKRGRANDVLPAVLADVPKDQVACVMHSFVLNQFSETDRQSFDAMLLDLSKDREIWRISLEWIGTPTPELIVTRYTSGHKDQLPKLAECNGHGEWIRWMGL